MNISDFAQTARASAGKYPKCSDEQALVYSVEDVVANELGWKEISRSDVNNFIDRVCQSEGIDTPKIEFRKRHGSTMASTSRDESWVCLRGAVVNVGVLIHEIAHLTAVGERHDQNFRDELVRLTRRHVGIEHAALLHNVFNAVNLSMSPWESIRS